LPCEYFLPRKHSLWMTNINIEWIIIYLWTNDDITAAVYISPLFDRFTFETPDVDSDNLDILFVHLFLCCLYRRIGCWFTSIFRWTNRSNSYASTAVWCRLDSVTFSWSYVHISWTNMPFPRAAWNVGQSQENHSIWHCSLFIYKTKGKNRNIEFVHFNITNELQNITKEDR